jgi:phosphoribosylformylglycinamidine synthase PurS subunit
MLFKAEVKVALKKGVLDPQGSAVEGAVRALGYGNVPQVRIGKYVELWVEAESEEAARQTVEELGRRILTNPVMETFTFTLAPSSDKLVPGALEAGVK